MIMYKLLPLVPVISNTQIVERLSDNVFIPFDPANTDYQAFKKEVLAGAELLDANGNVMTQEQANQFVGGLA